MARRRANQDLGTALHCVAACNPSAWSYHLSWIEYAHNSMPSAATGMFHLECSLGYQPPLFPAQEDDISVPSVQHRLRRCHRMWKDAHAALLSRTGASLTVTEFTLLPIKWVSKCGFPQGIFLFRLA